jgi:hypothetical protein
MSGARGTADACVRARGDAVQGQLKALMFQASVDGN